MSASPYVHCSWPQLVPVFPHWDIPNDIGGIPVPSSCRSINEWCYVDYWCSRWHVWTPNDLLILLHHSLWLRPKEDVEIQNTFKKQAVMWVLNIAYLLSHCKWVFYHPVPRPFHCCSLETLHESYQEDGGQGKMDEIRLCMWKLIRCHASCLTYKYSDIVEFQHQMSIRYRYVAVV